MEEGCKMKPSNGGFLCLITMENAHWEKKLFFLQKEREFLSKNSKRKCTEEW